MEFLDEQQAKVVAALQQRVLEACENGHSAEDVKLLVDAANAAIGTHVSVWKMASAWAPSKGTN